MLPTEVLVTACKKLYGIRSVPTFSDWVFGLNCSEKETHEVVSGIKCICTLSGINNLSSILELAALMTSHIPECSASLMLVDIVQIVPKYLKIGTVYELAMAE